MTSGHEEPADVLKPEQISNLMSPGSRHGLAGLTVLDQTDSTNSELQRLTTDQQHAHAILAETQSSGRGRRDRNWYSPPGCNIYLSLGWQFDSNQVPLSTLPLLAAICVCRALSRAGLEGHGIKWPNDILIGRKKLGGILVEMQATAGGASTAVIGMGLNINMPRGSREQQEADLSIDRQWTDLSSQLNESDPISRNAIIALLLEELIEGVRLYTREGFEPYREDWKSLDLLQGKQVEIEHLGQVVSGIARGIDPDGGLCVERMEQAGVTTFLAGEVRVFHD